MKLYHGTIGKKAISIINDGMFKCSSIDKLKNEFLDNYGDEKDFYKHLDITGYECLMNGVYFSNNIKRARTYAGLVGMDEENEVIDGKLVNSYIEDIGIVFEFEFNDGELNEMLIGEKTLNFIELDDNDNFTGKFLRDGWYTERWENLYKRNKNKAIEIQNELSQLNKNYIFNNIKDFSMGLRDFNSSLDLVYPKELLISKISNIYIYYDCKNTNFKIESNINSLINDINLVYNMQYQNIDFNKVLENELYFG